MTTPRLPPELLDHIADLLHDSKTTLRNCCLVSKSWVPRTRRHLFAEVRFDDTGGELGSWKGTFPDPSTSPAHYTKTLFFDSLQYATAADADWIKGFSSVVRFQWVGNRNPFADRSHITLVPFHGFSPVIISLSIHLAILPFSRLFNLILSFPLLEDLTAITCHDTLINIDNGSSTVVQPSNIPVFIGSLHISNHLQGIKSTAQWLLSLPGDISFRKLNLIWHKVEDIRLTMALVERCSHTLESLDITCVTSAESMSSPVDLSNATKLNDAAFRVISENVSWTTMALQTITPEHRDFRHISIFVPYHSLHCVYPRAQVERAVQETIYQQRLDLDGLLVQFWESRSIRPRVTCEMPAWEGQGVRDSIKRLLPEVTRRGIMDLLQ